MKKTESPALFLMTFWGHDPLDTRCKLNVHEGFRRRPTPLLNVTAQKMKFPITDFFSNCDQIRRKLRIWSHLLKKSLIENFIFCAVRLIRAQYNGKLLQCKLHSWPNFQACSFLFGLCKKKIWSLVTIKPLLRCFTKKQGLYQLNASDIYTKRWTFTYLRGTKWAVETISSNYFR